MRHIREIPAAVRLLLFICGVVVITPLLMGVAQDWVPFHVASGLAASRQWDSLYLPPNAQTVFDVSPRFRQDAVREIAENGTAAFRLDSLTGFVSPPPAAYLLTPVRGLGWQASLQAWRVALAVPLVVSLFVFGYTTDEPGTAVRWVRICAAGVPLLLYTVGSGQPSAWLAAAAIVSVLPPRRWLEAIGAAALALAILTKATPLLVAVGLCFVGRRRLGTHALILAAVVTVLTLPLTGFDPWQRFIAIASHLGRTVLTDWNNASFDAAAMRLVTGEADSVLRPLTGSVAAIVLTARLALLGFAAWRAFHKRSTPDERVSSIWIAWLAATPLLWLHYTTVLLPLLARRSGLRTLWVTLIAASLSAPLVLRVLSENTLLIGQLLTCAWLLAALVILWPRPRPELGAI